MDSDYDRDLDTLDPSLLWGAVHGSRVVGLVGLLVKTNPKQIEAEVEPIIVTREFRGKRIGERLLQKAIAEARARGARSVTVKPVMGPVFPLPTFH